MGMEKFLDIVCRAGGLAPSAVVLVATVRALKHHGGDPDGGLDAIERGAANLARHIGIVARVRPEGGRRGQPLPRRHRRGGRARPPARARAGAHARRAERGLRARRRGRGGARRGGRRRSRRSRTRSSHTYALDAPIAEKIEAIATPRLRRRRRRLPPGAPSRRSSASRSRASTGCRSAWRRRTCRSPHDPTLLNAPTGFTVPVRDVRAYTGAGWLVPLCGDDADDAGPRQHARRLRRRHRRARAHGRPLLVSVRDVRSLGRRSRMSPDACPSRLLGG